MKTKDLIRGYFENTVNADEVKKNLGTGGSSKPILRMIEMDQFGRHLLSAFEPESGAAGRLAIFIADQDPTPAVRPSPGKTRSRSAFLQPEVVGFGKRSRTRKPKKKSPARRKRKKR